MTRFCLRFHVLWTQLPIWSLIVCSVFGFQLQTCLCLLFNPGIGLWFKASLISPYLQGPFSIELSRNIADGSLHPQLGILSVQELDVWRHGLASCLTESLVKDALQLELSNTLGLLDLCSHLKQSIAGSDFHLAG
mgnify:CR=1 FL=1